jgi:hypothetical protein
MFRIIIQYLFWMAVVVAVFAVFGALMPILTHPIATIILIGFFVLFAVRLFKASQR